MKELIFLDTETTGNEIGKDRLCQVCYKTSKGIFTEYFKPPLPMSIKSMSITHITNKQLADKPPFIGSQMSKDLQSLLEDGILIAHNAKFDIAMLEAEGLKVPQKICTLRVARYLDPNNLIPEYNLQYLRYFLDLEVEGSAHDAEGDVNVLYAIFQRLLLKVKEELPKDEDAINKMLEISERPSLFTIFTFGKYKDKQIKDVLKTDRRYLEWLLSSKLENENNDEDWIYTLNYYLKKDSLF
ncbi:MAG: 3'-5' exonuclease [Candidatus Pacebacteria bacterium]|nr:3'-5' exonuclease [Candidatus Paceibacterota bacterium]